MRALAVVVILASLAIGVVEFWPGRGEVSGVVESSARHPSDPDRAAQVDARFHAALRAAVRDYRDFGQLMDAPFEGPALCDTIRLEHAEPDPLDVPRLSASADVGTHGRKLYWLFVKDRGDYLSHDGARAVPEGQVIIKESWHTHRIPLADAADRDLRREDHALHAESIRTLFVMLRQARETPGTDEGWVYGALTPDGETVLESGRIQSCMACHMKAERERLFGLKSR